MLYDAMEPVTDGGIMAGLRGKATKELRRRVAVVSVDSARDPSSFIERGQHRLNRGIAGNANNLITHGKVRAINRVDQVI